MKNVMHSLTKSLFSGFVLIAFSAVPVWAQDTTANAAPAQATDAESVSGQDFESSQTGQVFNVLMMEFMRNAPSGLRKQFDVDHIAKFQLSSESQEKLTQLYGAVAPLRIDVKKQGDGTAVVHYELQPLNHMEPKTRSMAHWDAVTVVNTYSKNRKEIATEWSWPAWQQTLGAQSWQMTDMKIAGTGTLNAPGIPLGNSSFSIAQLKLENTSDAKPVFQLNDVQASWSTVQKGQAATVGMKFHVKSATILTYSFDNLNFDFQMKNLNLKAMADFMLEMQKNQTVLLKNNNKGTADIFKASSKKSEQLAKDMIFSTTSVLNDLSVEYKGMPLHVTGSLNFTPAQNGKAGKAKKSAGTPEGFDLQAQLSTPRTLVVEIIKEIFAKQSPDARKSVPQEDIESRAQTLLQPFIDNGFLVDKGKAMLGSTLQAHFPLDKTKGGMRILLNGKDMSRINFPQFNRK